MSPEQAQAQPDVDARSDLWSVGAILFECLTGRPPYTGATYEQVIVNICMNDADDVRTYNPSVPEGVAEVLARALARDRDDRFADAREFLDALRAATGSLISSRGGSLDDGMPSDPGHAGQGSTRSTPNGPNGKRLTPRVLSDPALDATVKFHSTPPPREARQLSKRQQAVAAQRKMLAMVAVSALVLGGLGAFIVAKFDVGRAPIARGDGAAEGVAPARSEAAPEPPASPDPVVSAAASAAASVPVVEPSATADPRDHDKGPKAARPVVPSVPPPVVPPVKATAKPVETAAPAAPSGVAPTLKIKTY
jgi:serine/threonine-protein kinase